MRQLKLIKATYQVTTPMFLGGTDPRTAELRVPSIRGALRFWWRALAWQRLGGDLKRIQREEASLFGSSEQQIGQSRFLLDIELPGGEPRVLKQRQLLRYEYSKRTNDIVGPGVRYLGYGLMHAFKSKSTGTHAGELSRGCLAAGFQFTLKLLLKPNISQEQAEQLRDALRCLGLFGGLGSRARKGFGSVVLVSLDGEAYCPDPASFSDEVARLSEPDPTLDAPPAYSAFGKHSRVGILIAPPDITSGLATLNAFGEELVWFRSNGRGAGSTREVLRRPTTREERRFWGDHDLMLKAAKGQKVQQAPERIAFGLPHNYYFSSSRGSAQISPENYNRRASPLFIHVHHLPSRDPFIVVTFLPALFLPPREHISIQGGAKKSSVKFDQENIWRPIDDLFEHLIERPLNNKIHFKILRGA